MMSKSDASDEDQLKVLLKRRSYWKGQLTFLQKIFTSQDCLSLVYANRLPNTFRKLEDVLLEIAILSDDQANATEAESLESKFLTLDCAIRGQIEDASEMSEYFETRCQALEMVARDSDSTKTEPHHSGNQRPERFHTKTLTRVSELPNKKGKRDLTYQAAPHHDRRKDVYNQIASSVQRKQRF